jgi:hypothetical protein
MKGATNIAKKKDREEGKGSMSCPWTYIRWYTPQSFTTKGIKTQPGM